MARPAKVSACVEGELQEHGSKENQRKFQTKQRESLLKTL
jgi:hypothetical protein